MACKCIDRQRWIVQKLCKNGLSVLCRKAMARLERMEAQAK